MVSWRSEYKRFSILNMVSYLCRCNCTGSMVFKGKREDFLSNRENKHRFITLLQDHLERQGCHTEQATDDADLLVVQTVIAASENVSKPTVLIGEHTDLLVWLCFHTKSTSRNIYFRPEPMHGAKKSTRVLEHCFAQNNVSSGSVQQCVVYACYPRV